MEQKRLILKMPDKGLFSDSSAMIIPDGFSDDPTENVEWVGRFARKRPGTAGAITTLDSVTNAASGTEASVEPRAIHNFTNSAGTEYIMVYERGATGALVKKIYKAVGGTWAWTTLEKDSGWSGGGDWALQEAQKPRFINFRDKVYISNGDGGSANSDGLVYWDGSADAKRVTDEGATTHGASGRFMVIYKETLVLANGYYYSGSAWSASRLSSGLFFPVLVSSGTPVAPYQNAAWASVAATLLEVEPNDGGEIVAMWVWQDRIYIGKETGVWAFYGNPPLETGTIQKVSNIGMETDDSLQLHPDGQYYLFKNKDDWYAFDGRSDAVRIGEPIRNLVAKVPTFDIGGQADALEYEIDSAWDSVPPYDSTASSNIAFLPGSNGIELDKTAEAKLIDQTGTPDFTWNVVREGYRGFGYMFKTTDLVGADKFFLTKIKMYLGRGIFGQTGTIHFAIHKAETTGAVGEQVGSIVDVDINDISQLPSLYTVDFSSDNLSLDGDYYIVGYWDEDTITTLFVYTLEELFDLRPLAGKYNNGTWTIWHWYQKGLMEVWGNYYQSTGDYETQNNGCDLGSLPTEWGTIVIEDNGYGHPTYIQVEMRNGDGATPGSWSHLEDQPWEVLNNGDTPTQAITGQFIDFRITLNRIDGSKSPEVTRVKIIAYVKSTVTTDRLCCSTIFNDKYLCPTNMNLDGKYRTFVLDKSNRWSIDPDQLIRGFVDYNKEKYILTIDTNAKLHKMYRGTEAEQYYYDHSRITPTKTATLPAGSSWYYFKYRTRKFDLQAPGILKLLKELWFETSSIFADNFVQGILKYKIDNADWITTYFPDEQNTDPGDLIVRHIFPAGKRGNFIQFEFQTYVNSTTNYGMPYSIKDLNLDYFLQPGLKPIRKTTTTIGAIETGNMVE